MFPNERAFDGEIAAAHRAFRAVPEQVIRAVIGAESGYNPRALRAEPHLRDASRGLMQLLYKTAQGVGYGGTPENLFAPAVNVYYGTALLARLYQSLGEWDAVFSAYNGGIRPSLGYGARAARSLTVCDARDPQSGTCIKSHVVQPGEFANQAYVDRVRRILRYFGRGETGSGALALLLGISLAVAALTRG